jgi:alpha/beta hydrolase family protein
MSAQPNVVLVDGAWADGSSWSAVIERLQAGGYHVTAPQFPTTTLADNVARLRQVLAVQDGPAPVTPALVHLITDEQGFTWLSEDDFENHFAADVDPVKAKVMYAVQQPLAASSFGDVMGVPAWKSLPTWYLVAANDEAIPPPAERQFAARMGATTV